MNAPTSLGSLRQQGGDIAKSGAGNKSQFNDFLAKLQPQLARTLPKHMKADRMARLALTAFSNNPDMQACSFQSIANSLMTAGALGLEPGINGAGFLIPYKGVCTFVPGWKGLVDLVSRSGRASVWTGAVFAGDHFDFALGDRPFIQHRPGDETDPAAMTHVYSVGRVNGADWPIIEVWSVAKVKKHRDKFNKQGGKHYSFREPEMYGRKVPLLQVLKYLPSSIEIANAISASEAGEAGRAADVVIDGDFVTITDPGTAAPTDEGADAGVGQLGNDPSPTISAETFATRERVVLRSEQPSETGAADAAAPRFDSVAFEARMARCKDVEMLDLMADELRSIPDAAEADRLTGIYRRARLALQNSAPPMASAPAPAAAPSPAGRRTSAMQPKPID